MSDRAVLLKVCLRMAASPARNAESQAWPPACQIRICTLKGFPDSRARGSLSSPGLVDARGLDFHGDSLRPLL